jgi:hypothetical protein
MGMTGTQNRPQAVDGGRVYAGVFVAFAVVFTLLTAIAVLIALVVGARSVHSLRRTSTPTSRDQRNEHAGFRVSLRRRPQREHEQHQGGDRDNQEGSDPGSHAGIPTPVSSTNLGTDKEPTRSSATRHG